MKAETIEKIKQIYQTRKNVIEYLIAHGNDQERAEAEVIKEIALENPIKTVGKTEQITA